MKYAWIEAHRHQYRLAVMCRVLEVGRSSSYAARVRAPSAHSRMDVALRLELVRLHEQHRHAPGAVKAWRLLNQQGIVCGKHRVARLRKLEGLVARRQQKYRVTREHQQTEPAAPNLLRRRFTVTAPDKVWVSDITTIRTREGWLHLAIVLDLYARLVVGWAMSAAQSVDLPIAALNMALLQRRPAPGLLCHTDQGSVYGASTYRDLLTAHGVRPSMSRRGNCHDNAVAESFFSTLKNEMTHHTIYDSRAQARAAIADYIEVYYNRARPHQTLGYRTPIETEEKRRSA